MHSALQHTATHCNSAKRRGDSSKDAPHPATHAATRYNTRIRTAAHVFALQHTDWRCNTPQHAATH